MEGERWCCDHFDEKNSISKTGMLTVIFCAILRTTTTPVRWEASGEERFVISRVAGVIEGFWWCEVKWVCLNSLSKLKTQSNQIWWIGHQNRIPCQVHKIGNKKEHAWSVMAWFHDDWMMVGNSAVFETSWAVDWLVDADRLSVIPRLEWLLVGCPLDETTRRIFFFIVCLCFSVCLLKVYYYRLTRLEKMLFHRIFLLAFMLLSLREIFMTIVYF